jgi:hypothetical protein
VEVRRICALEPVERLANLALTTLASLHLFVNARVPSDRNFSVKEQGTKVFVHVPSTYRGIELTSSTGACSQRGATDYSESIGANIIVLGAPKAECKPSSGGLWWMYVVGAPGYAIISGKVNL